MREVGGERPRTRCEPGSEHGSARLRRISVRYERGCREIQDDLEIQIDIETCTSTRSTTRRIGKVCVCQTRDSSWSVTRPALEEISFRLLNSITQSDRCRV